MKFKMPSEDYTKLGYWKNINLYSFLEKNAKENGERTALVDQFNRYSYIELVEQVKKTAGALKKMGIKEGEVVSFQLPNWCEGIIIYKALQMIGAISNPINPIFRKKEVEYIVKQADSKILIIPYTFRNFNYIDMARSIRTNTNLEMIIILDRYNENPDLQNKEMLYSSFLENGWLNDEVFKVNEETISTLLFTSGTTSMPKGALQSHNTNYCVAENFKLKFEIGPKDTVLAFGTLASMTGVACTIETPMVNGSKVVLQDIWDSRDAMELLLDEGITWVLGATPFLKGILNEFEQLDNDKKEKLQLQQFLCGGADVNPDLILEATEKLNCFVGRIYGSTESGMKGATTKYDPLEKASRTDGSPPHTKKMKIIDNAGQEVPMGTIGEVAVKGPDLFLGYLQDKLNEEAFLTDGYFLTGDLGIVDEEGYIEVRGRKKDIIIRGGQNISVKEIEDLLYEHPSISEVAIVSMPDERLGEKACAYVVLRDGKILSFDEMKSFLLEKEIAKHKLPERLEIIDKMPLNANGKILKFVLREDIRKKLPTGVNLN